MNAENYLEFTKYFKVFEFACNHNAELVFNEGKDPVEFNANIRASIPKCKVFEIEPELKKLLIMTKTPNKNLGIKLPFPFVFLDVSFTKEELAEYDIHIKADKLTGILFTEGTLLFDREIAEREWDIMKQAILDAPDDEITMIVNPLNQKRILKTREGDILADEEKGDIIAGRALRITLLSRMTNEKGEYWFETFNRNFDFYDMFKEYNLSVQEVKSTDKKAREFIHSFVINFLNFLHNPEVRYVEHIRSEKNQMRRKKEGKEIIPSTMTVQITGELKKYIDVVKTEGHLGRYSFRFWVRGHFRRLVSDRYKEKKVLFIAPYVKGQGVLVEKLYKVDGGMEDGKSTD